MYEFEQNIPPILKRSDRDFWKTKLVSSTNVRISNVRRISDRILSFVRVREARDDIRQNFNPNLKIKLYKKTLRIAHRYSIDRLLFPQKFARILLF